jgi:anti-repressor protein
MNNQLQSIESRNFFKLRENGEVAVSCKELYEFLDIKTEYKKWFQRMVEYGFVKNQDYIRVSQKCPTLGGIQQVVDHILKIEMAKEIAMIQRSEKGKEARQYFIDAEKKWNNSKMINNGNFAYSNNEFQRIMEENEKLKKQLFVQRSKVLFANSIELTNSTSTVGVLAKILRQNGVDTGKNRLFEWMRQNGYLIKRRGADYSTPTQMSIEAGWLRINEEIKTRKDGTMCISKTIGVTGSGQAYFINKFIHAKNLPFVN